LGINVSFFLETSTPFDKSKKFLTPILSGDKIIGEAVFYFCQEAFYILIKKGRK